MKKTLFTLLSAILILAIGCSTAPQIKNTNPIEERVLKIVVESKNDSEITVTDETGEKYEPLTSPYLQLSGLTKINRARTEAYSKLFSGLSVSDVTKTYTDFMYLIKETNIKDWYIYINSPGGDAFSGIALAGIIKKAQRHGFKVITVASGIVASAAVPIFAVGTERIAEEGTTFMVHEAALWKWPGRETASDIRAQNELMILLKDHYLKLLANNSDLTLEEWEILEVKTTWFGVSTIKAPDGTDKPGAKQFGLLGPNKRLLKK